MAENEIVIDARPEDVETVLADATCYSNWVVGAKHVRDVQPGWPAEGTRFHHTVGVGPIAMQDHTELLEHHDGRWVLDARAWPAGRARIVLDVEPRGTGTRVKMHERPVSGPGAALPRALADPVIRFRNDLALKRLRDTVLAVRTLRERDG